MNTHFHLEHSLHCFTKYFFVYKALTITDELEHPSYFWAFLVDVTPDTWQLQARRKARRVSSAQGTLLEIFYSRRLSPFSLYVCHTVTCLLITPALKCSLFFSSWLTFLSLLPVTVSLCGCQPVEPQQWHPMAECKAFLPLLLLTSSPVSTVVKCLQITFP